jgi:hypothetical protein
MEGVEVACSGMAEQDRGIVLLPPQTDPSAGLLPSLLVAPPKAPNGGNAGVVALPGR